MISKIKACLWAVGVFCITLVSNAYGAGQPSYISEPIEDVFDNRPTAMWFAIEAVAKEQASSQPIVKSNAVEGRAFEGYFKANSSTSKLALFSDDGGDVYIDGVRVHSAKGVGQHLPNLTQSLKKIDYTFEAGKLYKIVIDYSNDQLTSTTDIDGVTLFCYDGGGTIVEADLPQLRIAFPHADYITDSIQEVWVGINGPESLKGQQFNVILSGGGQSQIVPLEISDNINENIAIAYVEIPPSPGPYTYKAEVKVLQETVWDRITIECVVNDPEADAEGSWQLIADSSVNASVREALRKAATDPDEALAILDTLKNSTVYSGRAKGLIDTAIAVSTVYKAQAQSGGALPWARINPDFLIDLVKKVGSDIATKFVQALSRGHVRAVGEAGIKRLNPPIKGYEFELKILGTGGKYRLLGNAKDVGDRLVIEFVKLGGHK